jgi:dTDP-4-dehydrorhamnose reductase
MMNVLVTGSNGQLGSELKKIHKDYSYWNFLFLDLPELDITNLASIENFVKDHSITKIINCAAYTAVDLAETNKELAEKVNVMGARNLAQISVKYSISLIHISTDFVFDGKHYLPYEETDMPNPLSVYGRTKLDGENEILRITPNAIILRTSWLYSAFGANFVKTMQRLGSERESLRVIFDQVGTPTWAADLAQTILIVVEHSENQKDIGGVYHYSNEGCASWYDFATEIMELSQISCLVIPIGTSQYPTPASRPFYSVLNKEKIKHHFGLQIPHWKVSLKKCIEELKNK